MKKPETTSPNIIRAPAELRSSCIIGTAAELGAGLVEELADAADGLREEEEDVEALEVDFIIVLDIVEVRLAVAETALDAGEGVSMP